MTLPTLDGRQHQVAFMSTAGHYVVQGTAGSGKTVMAIVRAGHLSRSATPNSGPTLLLTHTNSLVKYLRHLADGEADSVTIETYSKFARGYLASLGLMSRNSVAADDASWCLRQAIGEHRTGATAL
jgi:DNA helicase IV